MNWSTSITNIVAPPTTTSIIVARLTSGKAKEFIVGIFSTRCFASDLINSITSSTLSSTVTTSDFDLELTNILCIALIVVGVLLILLAIAILIRLKN